MASQPISIPSFLEELSRTGRGDPTQEFLDAARRAVAPLVEGELDATLDPAGEVRLTQLVGGQRVPVACEWVSQDQAAVARHHALHDALNAVALAYFPATVFPEGSLGALLQAGGGWARGTTVTADDVTVTLERSFLRSTRMRPTSEWVEYGFELRVRIDGRALQMTCSRAEHEGNIDAWARLPTSDAARAQLEDILQALARQVRAELRPTDPLEDVINGHTATSLVLARLVQPAAPGSVMTWLQEAMPRLLTEHAHEVEGHRYRITEVFAPQSGLEGFGAAAVRISVDDDEEDVLELGALGPAALTQPGPRDDAERRDVEGLISSFLAWLDASLDAYDDVHFGGYFPLVSLLEQRLLRGPPGPPPVPPADEVALTRAAAKLEPTEHEGSVAAWRYEGWTVLLHDDLGRRPFSEPGLSLVPPEGGAPCVVMMCDAWNPEAKAVVDGDAFAFRRFVGWLRGVVLVSGHDPELVFELEEDDRDEDEPASYEVRASEWLLFGLPDFGDRFLLDWRSQWHIVRASSGVEAFAGIYGFTGEKLDQLRTRDVPTWRRFLREVIDPRFG